MKTIITIKTTCFLLLIGFQAGAQIHKEGGAEYLGPDWYRVTENFTNSPLPVTPVDYIPFVARDQRKIGSHKFSGD